MVTGVNITDVDGVWLVGGLHTNIPVLDAAGGVCSI